MYRLLRTYFTLFLLTTAMFSATAQTLWGTHASYFGGLSLNMQTEDCTSTDIVAAFHSIKAQGVTTLRIVIDSGDEKDFAHFDTLLTIADTIGFRTCIAIADTLIADSASQTVIKRVIIHHSPRIAAYILQHTRIADAETLATFARWLHRIVPQCYVGLSIAHAEDVILQQAIHGNDYDFFALRLGYTEQQWASRDMVDASMPFVFTRLPMVVSDVCRKIELTERPLIIDYIDYPRDRGFRYSTSGTLIRDNIVNFARDVVNEHAEQVRGMFLGDFAPTCDTEQRRQTQTVYVTDSSTIRILTQPMQ